MACPNISLSLLEADTAEKRQFGLGLYVFGQLFCTICLAVFLWGKYMRGFDRIKRRHAILVVSGYIGAMIQSQVDPLEMTIGPTAYYCVVKLILSLLIIPFMGVGLVGKLMAFFFRTRFEMQAIARRQERGSEHVDDTNQYTRTKRFMGTMAEGAKELFLFKDSPQLELGSLRFLQSGRATVILLVGGFLLPSFIIGLIVILTDPVMVGRCVGCSQSSTVGTFLLVQAIVACLLLLAALARVRHLPDNWGNIPETLVSLIFAVIGVTGFALTFLLNNDYPVWNFTFLMSIGIWGMIFTQTILQVLIAWRIENGSLKRNSKRVENTNGIQAQFNSQRELSKVESSRSIINYKLPAVLADPVLAKQFEEHLAREFGVESLFFYRDAQRWTAEYSDVSANTRKVRAKHIVKVYIKNNGVFAINVPSAVSKALIQVVEQQLEPPKDFFASAITEIQDLLERGALLRFKNELLRQQDQHPLGIHLNV